MVKPPVWAGDASAGMTLWQFGWTAAQGNFTRQCTNTPFRGSDAQKFRISIAKTRGVDDEGLARMMRICAVSYPSPIRYHTKVVDSCLLLITGSGDCVLKTCGGGFLAPLKMWPNSGESYE